MKFTKNYISEAIDIIKDLDLNKIEAIVDVLLKVKKVRGRVFFLGVGGSAANASHMVNDFRKLANIECYSPSDNISELTARINDDGWRYCYSGWLKVSNLRSKDVLFILSVGGGDKKKISENLIEAIKLAKKKGAKILGVVGPNGGYTNKMADVSLRINVKNLKNQTPHSEAIQMLISHLLVSHTKLKVNKTKW